MSLPWLALTFAGCIIGYGLVTFGRSMRYAVEPSLLPWLVRGCGYALLVFFGVQYVRWAWSFA